VNVFCSRKSYQNFFTISSRRKSCSNDWFDWRRTRKFEFLRGLAAYSSSKGAVITLTGYWRKNIKKKGISFNVLALGSVQTEMLNEAFPGYQAPISPRRNGSTFIFMTLTLNGNKYYNGRRVSSTNP